MIKATNPYEIKPPTPKVLPPNYAQGIDNLSSEDFLKIYMETLKYQDPFQQQDLSKMLQDMVQLNQIKYFNDVKSFLENIKGWFNQFTLLSGMSLVGKELVFSTNSVDTVKGGKYYLLSSQEVKDATVKIMDGDTTVK
ncbi:MAG: flagellar hook assembly protein FlgD, partial [Aquificota bacterium]